jgi:hypothetical protein
MSLFGYDSFGEFSENILIGGLPEALDFGGSSSRNENQHIEDTKPIDAAPASNMTPAAIPSWALYAGAGVLGLTVLVLLVKK